MKTGKKNKNKNKTGLHQINKLLNTKGNYQQKEKAT